MMIMQICLVHWKTAQGGNLPPKGLTNTIELVEVYEKKLNWLQNLYFMSCLFPKIVW